MILYTRTTRKYKTYTGAREIVYTQKHTGARDIVHRNTREHARLYTETHGNTPHCTQKHTGTHEKINAAVCVIVTIRLNITRVYTRNQRKSKINHGR